MNKFSFNPAKGFEDKSRYPDPSSEDDTRKQFQSLHNQTRDFINDTIVPEVTNLEKVFSYTYRTSIRNKTSISFKLPAASTGLIIITFPGSDGASSYTGQYVGLFRVNYAGDKIIFWPMLNTFSPDSGCSFDATVSNGTATFTFSVNAYANIAVFCI